MQAKGGMERTVVLLKGICSYLLSVCLPVRTLGTLVLEQSHAALFFSFFFGACHVFHAENVHMLACGCTCFGICVCSGPVCVFLE